MSVIAFPCDEPLRSPHGLELWGPEAFGYDFTYVPVEQLNGTDKHSKRVDPAGS